MQTMLVDILNNRELAILIWILAFLTYAFIRKPSIIKQVLSLFKMFFISRLFLFFLLTLLPVFLLAVTLRHYDVWGTDMLKISIAWGLMSGIVTFLNASQISDETIFFKQKLAILVNWSVLLGFLFNLYVFHLFWELILIPVITILTLIASPKISAGKKDKEVRELASWLLAIIGFMLLIFVSYALLGDINSFLTFRNLQIMLLPVAFSLFYAPSIYLLALYMHYQSLFTIMSYMFPKLAHSKRIQGMCIRKCGISVKKVCRFKPFLLNEVSRTASEKAFSQSIQRFK